MRHHHRQDRARGCGGFPEGAMRHMAGWGDAFRAGAGRGHFGGGGFDGDGSARGPGRRRRIVDAEQLRLLLVELIGEQPRHGYDLIKALGELSHGQYAPSPGMVYPQLAMLADEGLIAETSDGGTRKSYELTADGAVLREERATDIAAIVERLKALASQTAPVDAEPVRRAMHNLKSVLIARLSADSVDKDLMFKAVDLIDETARKIERL